MAAVSVKLAALLKAVLTIVLPAGYAGSAASGASYRTLTLDDFGLDAVLDGDNTPTPTAVVAGSYTIGAGDTTIDLTSDAPVMGAVDGSGLPEASEDLTGKKLQAVIVETPTANAAAVTVKPAAANGYALWGATNEVDFLPHTNLMMVCQDSDQPAVAAGAKDIVLSGTQNDVINLILVFQG